MSSETRVLYDLDNPRIPSQLGTPLELSVYGLVLENLRVHLQAGALIIQSGDRVIELAGYAAASHHGRHVHLWIVDAAHLAHQPPVAVVVEHVPGAWDLSEHLNLDWADETILKGSLALQLTTEGLSGETFGPSVTESTGRQSDLFANGTAERLGRSSDRIEIGTGSTIVIDHTGATQLTAITEDRGLSSHDFITNDNSLVLHGASTAVVPTQVELFIDGVALGSAVVTNGSWLFDNTAVALADGTHQVEMDLVDVATGVIIGRTSQAITIDTMAPAAATILDAHNDSGLSAHDKITNDGSQLLTGQAEAGTTVTVFDNGVAIGTAKADTAGDWHLTAGPLSDGTHSFTLSSADVAGNTSAGATTWSMVVDTTIAAPLITATSIDSGSSATDHLTNYTSQTLTGTAEPDSVVSISIDGVVAGSATVDGAGNWQFTTIDLNDGKHQFTAQAEDTAGNISLDSAAWSVTIDTTAAPPVITGYDDDTGVVGDGITADNTLVLKGSAGAGESVVVFDAGNLLGTTTADGSGLWSFSTASLADGVHNFSARSTDAAGNVSGLSNRLEVDVDTQPLAPAEITGWAMDSGDVGDGITAANQPPLTGTAPVGSLVEVFANGTSLGTAIADAGGNWQFSPSPLADGSYLFTITATIGGVLISGTVAEEITIDTTPPAPPVITHANADTGLSATDHVTNDAIQTLTGTAEAESRISVYDGATLLGTTTADSNGAWSFTTAALSDGTHDFTASAADAAGNQGASSATWTVTVDTVAPAAPSIIIGDPATHDYVVVWQSEDQDGSGNGVFAQLFAADGGRIGTAFQVNTFTVGNQDQQNVTSLADGSFVVTWESTGQDGSSSGVFGQHFAADGSRIGSEFQVNTTTANTQDQPDITGLGDGSFVVTWESDGQDGNGRGVFGQHFAADGSRIGTEFQINTFIAGTQDQPSIAGLTDGGFVVVWESNGEDGNGAGVYGQLFAADGSQVSGEFQVNTFTTGTQDQPDVAALADGSFIVTWESGNQDGNNNGVFGQHFAADGSKIGTEFQVNTTTKNAQDQPSITGLADGSFVVTWESNGQDGNNAGVFGQHFAADGSTIGGEFQINTYTKNGQDEPSVSGLVDGSFIVTWESDRQDGSGLGIFAQHFAADGSKIGSEFRVNSFTAGDQDSPAVASLGQAYDELADHRLTPAEAADGTHVGVSLAGSGAVAGDMVTLLWGHQQITHVLTAAEVANDDYNFFVSNAVIDAAGTGAINVKTQLTDIAGNSSPWSTAETIFVGNEVNAATTGATLTGTAGQVDIFHFDRNLDHGTYHVTNFETGEDVLSFSSLIDTGAANDLDILLGNISRMSRINGNADLQLTLTNGTNIIFDGQGHDLAAATTTSHAAFQTTLSTLLGDTPLEANQQHLQAVT